MEEGLNRHTATFLWPFNFRMMLCLLGWLVVCEQYDPNTAQIVPTRAALVYVFVWV